MGRRRLTKTLTIEIPRELHDRIHAQALAQTRSDEQQIVHMLRCLLFPMAEKEEPHDPTASAVEQS